jgi:AcrR family transcriptional regulator
MSQSDISPKNKWDAIKKDGLIKAVIRVITQTGIHGLTMDAVAQEAGISKGSLYNYFDTKEMLIETTIRACISELKESTRDLLESHIPPDRKLNYMILRHLNFFDDNRDLFRILLHEKAKRHAFCRKDEEDGYSQYLEILSRVYQEGVDAGIFKPMQTDKIARIIAEACFGMVSYRILVDASIPSEEDTRFVTEFIMNGISAKEKTE